MYIYALLHLLKAGAMYLNITSPQKAANHAWLLHPVNAKSRKSLSEDPKDLRLEQRQFAATDLNFSWNAIFNERLLGDQFRNEGKVINFAYLSTSIHSYLITQYFIDTHVGDVLIDTAEDTRSAIQEAFKETVRARASSVAAQMNAEVTL